MNEFVESSSYFFVALTVVAFGISSALQKKWKIALLNPIAIGALLVFGILKLCGISNEAYQAGCQVLTYLLTPATVCLALALYRQFRALKSHLPAIAAGILCGVLCSLGSVYLMGKLLGLDQIILRSLLPKSVTAAVGLALSEEIGGIIAITAAAVSITGILGNMLGPVLCKLFRIKEPIAQGVAFGTASHVIGTSKASEMSQLAGAVGSLSLTLAGLFTSAALSFLAPYL